MEVDNTAPPTLLLAISSVSMTSLVLVTIRSPVKRLTLVVALTSILAAAVSEPTTLPVTLPTYILTATLATIPVHETSVPDQSILAIRFPCRLVLPVVLLELIEIPLKSSFPLLATVIAPPPHSRALPPIKLPDIVKFVHPPFRQPILMAVMLVEEAATVCAAVS